MRWDEDWGRADCDLDLALLRWDTSNNRWVTVQTDDRIQNGSAGSIPMAWVRTDQAVAEYWDYALAINKGTCATNRAWVQLIAWKPVLRLRHVSTGFHTGNPEESRNAGMLAVGATNYWDTSTIAAYSSRGPTIDGRTKPDITGIVCGTTTTHTPVSVGGHQCWFHGTSQAAPHIAGMAALVKQRFPNYSPIEIVRYLEQNAADRGAVGDDNTWGHGLAALPVVQTSPPPPTLPRPIPVSPTSASPPTGNIKVRDGINPGEVVVSWDAVNEATYYRIGYVNMVTDYPLAKASNTGEWLEAFVYVDVNALNFTEQGGRVEYTVRRLAPGVRHAFTVLTSRNVENTREYFGGRYSWPSNPRWSFHTTAP